MGCGRHRSITLSETDTRPDPGFAAASDTPNTLPLLGRIAAGLPIEAIPDQNNVHLRDLLMGPNRYILKVQGESMIEAGILDDDMVVIEKPDDAPHGKSAATLVANT
mgnify:CR=1 FL=1